MFCYDTVIWYRSEMISDKSPKNQLKKLIMTYLMPTELSNLFILDVVQKWTHFRGGVAEAGSLSHDACYLGAGPRGDSQLCHLLVSQPWASYATPWASVPWNQSVCGVVKIGGSFWQAPSAQRPHVVALGEGRPCHHWLCTIMDTFLKDQPTACIALLQKSQCS